MDFPGEGHRNQKSLKTFQKQKEKKGKKIKEFSDEEEKREGAIFCLGSVKELGRGEGPLQKKPDCPSKTRVFGACHNGQESFWV